MWTINLLGMAAILCVAAVGLPGQPERSSPGVSPGASLPVSVTIRTDKKTYGPMDPIKLNMFVKNGSKLPAKLTFTSGMKYDFEIRKGKAQSAERVWQWSRGHMFTQMVTSTTMQPGKTMAFSESYVPAEMGPDGKPVAALEPGAYTVTAILTTSGRTPRPMASTTFAVK